MTQLTKNFLHYLSSNFAVRAISFVSIPIFTRLLSTEDYGIINLFSTYVGIFSVVLTFNFHVAVGRYYYDKKDDGDFKDFVGTTFSLLFFTLIFFSLLFVLFRGQISAWLGIPVMITLLIPLSVIVSTTGSIFNQIMQPLYQSKKIAVYSIVSSYSAFALSLIFVLLLTENKYLGQIWGQLLIGIFFFVFYLRELRPLVNYTFKKPHFPYIWKYSVPLIPHSLNGVILSQIDRVQINGYLGTASVGMYSFAYNIGMLMSVFSTTILQTWMPRYFEYMNAKDYAAHDRDIEKLNRYLVLASIFLIMFGNEIGFVLAASKFHEALNIIPLVVLGYYFEGIFAVYARNIGYSKKTIYATLIAFASGLLNIGLNILLIPKYGYKVASITTLLSYMSMALLAYLVNKFILKLHSTPVVLLARTALYLIPATGFVYLLGYFDLNFFLGAILKALVFLPLAFIIMPAGVIATYWSKIKRQKV